MGRLLVADNEALQRILLRELVILSDPSWNVIEASDGLAALEMIRAEKPEIVLMDVRMPKMDGITVCKLLKADPELKHIAVIMVTASREDEYRVEAQEAGCSAYITKPVDADELLNAIQEVLHPKSNS